MVTFDRLLNRYELVCELHNEAGLHIGTGVAGTETDAPFILQGGKPFVPGSSLRGALRSTVERIMQTLDPMTEVQCCVLFDETPPGAGRKACTAGTKALREEFEQATPQKQRAWMRSGEFRLCRLCQFFGCTLMASKLKIGDATPSAGAEPRLVVRDGVGINRDTETAQEQIKYDFQVLEQGVQFMTTVLLENAEPFDFALLYILLQEWKQGVDFGGKKARGLGCMKLTNYTVKYFDPEPVEAEHKHDLKAFLREGLKLMDKGEFDTSIQLQFEDQIGG